MGLLDKLFGFTTTEREIEYKEEWWNTAGKDIREYLTDTERHEYTKLLDDVMLNRRANDKDRDSAKERLVELHSIAQSRGY